MLENLWSLVLKKYELLLPSLSWTFVALSFAYLADLLFGKGNNPIQILKKFSSSNKKDVAYWLIYICGAGAALSYLTPPGWLRLLWNHFAISQFHYSTINWSLPPIAGTLLALVVADLAHYWTHRFMHEVPFLWQFHSIHHAAKEMFIITGSRVAFTEVAINTFFATMVTTVLGLDPQNIFWIVFIRQIIDVLQHSNLSWTYGFLGYIFASPVNHYYHHSSADEDWDRNYGNILAIWDHIFGTANPKMKNINSSLNHDTRPPLGVPEGSEPFNTGLLSLPILQELAIWTSSIKSFFTKRTPVSR